MRFYANWVLGLAVLVYVSAVALLYSFQVPLLYRADTEYISAREMKLVDASEITLKTGDGEILRGWFRAPTHNRPTILYIHGKGGTMASRADRWRYYAERNYGILFFDFRGFGGSSGSPNEAGLLEDTLTAYDWLISKGVLAKELFVVGESLGTGLAVMLAAKRDVAAVSLEGAYSSIVDVAAARHWWAPVRLLIKDEFDVVDVVRNVHVPLLIQHGEFDRTIPIRFARKLFDAANEPKTWLEVKAGQHGLGEPAFQRGLEFFASSSDPMMAK